MKTKSVVIGLVLCLIFTSCSDHEKEAKRLYVEANQMLPVAVATEDPSQRAELYKAILAKLDEVLSKYPETEMAVGIVQGRNRIGSWSVGEFRMTVIPQVARVAEIMTEVEAMGKEVEATLKKVEADMKKNK